MVNELSYVIRDGLACLEQHPFHVRLAWYLAMAATELSVQRLSTQVNTNGRRRGQLRL